MNAITFTLSPYAIIIAGVVIVAFLLWLVHRQRLLKRRAYLMREAMRNRDFTFRLRTDGLLPGERAMQETLNDLGEDISRMVAKNEVESWQRLIRVLTHEIMNATAPICSISQAYMDSPDIKGSPFEDGIRAIHSTGTALASFATNFRKFTQLQTPVVRRVSVAELVGKVRTLFPALEWHVDIPQSAMMLADEGMLMQVMINLAGNAVDAGTKVMAFHWNGMLLVSNNGEPIPSSIRDNIFIPFFTTKAGGSGIGLALSRQLMICQGGNLLLLDAPIPGWHTTFAVKPPSP